jgi:hypothetical protein
MNDYAVYVNWEIQARIKRVRGNVRVQIHRFLDTVGSDPFQEGDEQTKIEGRDVEVKYLSGYKLLFWADHPVKEIKVIEFCKVRTRRAR